MVINGNYGNAYPFTILPSTGGYQTVILPLSSLGSPATITEVVIQVVGNSGGAGSIFYVDDLGFI
jgi:hypothetical protein